VNRVPRKPLHVVILAAGLGKRMKSKLPKVLHPLAGRPMIAYPLAAAAALKPDSVVLVLGRGADQVRSVVEEEAERLGLAGTRIAFALQARQLGTGHAVMQAEGALKGARGDLLILSGDVPAIRADTLRRLVRRHRAARAAATVLTMRLADPSGYGRVIRGAGSARGEVERIVEHVDASAAERRVEEINAGIYVADARGIFAAVRGAKRSNAQKEYYLTDMVEAFRGKGGRVIGHEHAPPDEVMGVNDRRDLARAARLLNDRAVEGLMKGGVTIVDPARTDVESTVKVGADTVIHPGVTLAGRTRIGSGCVLHPGTRVQDAILGDGCVVLDHSLIVESRIGSGVRIGPMAHLRPGTDLADDVRIGNFVETKKTKVGRGSKANHLTYLGDAKIGGKVNVGAGTITCNYDGKNKHQTVMDDGVFIGSNAELVAPVRIGRGAYVAAGSTITKDVPAGALGVGRARQSNKEGWVESQKKRAARASKKKTPSRKRKRRG